MTHRRKRQLRKTYRNDRDSFSRLVASLPQPSTKQPQPTTPAMTSEKMPRDFEPLAEGWRSFTWPGGCFDTAVRPPTPMWRDGLRSTIRPSSP